MYVPFIIAAVIVAGSLVTVFALVRLRNMHYWLGTYLSSPAKRQRAVPERATLYVCVADHFEPFGQGVERTLGQARLDRWMSEYPRIAARHRDSFGGAPKHTFFYPLEDYDEQTLDRLAEISRAGYGDVEVHYHHDNDNAASLRRALLDFKQRLRHRHHLLRDEPGADDGVYCFIHGNWALDNSRPDGRWCGVDNELSVLIDTGCKVDFTMPSAPSDTQTRKINSIYFARGRPGCRKSHDAGRDVAVGHWGSSEELLLVQGPLGLNWKSRKLGVIPRIENGEISADTRPTPDRVRLWAGLAPTVAGAPEHIFLKLHTHGAPEATMNALLGGDLERMWSWLEAEFRDRPGRQLKYVTAWEMYATIRAIAAGQPLPGSAS
jgi:hypothetical protein